MRTRFVAGIAAALCLSSSACSMFAGTPHVRTDAALGKVIIYRNGVAYFERSAHFEGDTLSLNVPASRVDDFLKSLTVVDAATGTALPVSLPAADRAGDTVEIKIQVATPGSHQLRLSYVTESPAWKPTYRIVLGKGGKGRLHAWAVVDNVSGEDWKQVTIGVGSTSALSFKYDLRSVRMVERETIASDSLLAIAPPTGGSPYTVGGQEIRILGNVALDEVENIASQQTQTRRIMMENSDASEIALGATTARYQAPASGRKTPQPTSAPPAPPREAAQSNMARQAAGNSVDRVASQLRSGNHRVRIEGYARNGDSDPRQASLDRANVVREQLIAQGVPAERVDAVGTGQMNSRDGVRIVAAEAEAPKPAQAAHPAAGTPADNEPIGTAFFVSGVPMTIDDGRSAMVSLVNAESDARSVYFYDPVSARGSTRFAFKAVRLVNPSDYTLDSGPFTVYAGGQFLGEGLAEPIPPRTEAFIPYGLDRELVVDPVVASREEITKLITIQRGIVSTESRTVRQTKLTLSNRGRAGAEVYVRHALPEGWTLEASKHQVKKLGGAYLFTVNVPARGSVDLVIEQWTPLRRTIDLHTDPGVQAIGLYLKNARMDPSVQSKLDDIVRMHREIGELEEKGATLESQMGVYRTRVDEINVQLVTLRKVATAQQLSRNLAQKMEEISNRLQSATVELSDLKGQLMTKRIAIQDRLAELTLETREKTP